MCMKIIISVIRQNFIHAGIYTFQVFGVIKSGLGPGQV